MTHTLEQAFFEYIIVDLQKNSRAFNAPIFTKFEYPYFHVVLITYTTFYPNRRINMEVRIEIHLNT